MTFKYIGKDPTTDWLPGVPRRDLTAAEAKQWPEAEASGLYVAEKARKQREPRAPRVVEKPEETPAGHGEEQEN